MNAISAYRGQFLLFYRTVNPLIHNDRIFWFCGMVKKEKIINRADHQKKNDYDTYNNISAHRVGFLNYE